MAKQYISFRKDSAKSWCNHAFYFIKERLRSSLRETEDHDSDLAAVLGTLGGFYVALGGEGVFTLANIFGANVPLDDITRGCLYGVILSSSATVLVKYDVVKEWVNENLRYSAGANGVLFGASLKAMLTLYT